MSIPIFLGFPHYLSLHHDLGDFIKRLFTIHFMGVKSRLIGFETPTNDEKKAITKFERLKTDGKLKLVRLRAVVLF